MKTFINQLIKYLIIPNLILLSIVYYVDIFQIFGGFQDYYENQTIKNNRSFITANTYYHFRKNKKFNSFIFGSSRSLSFKCKDWDEYLDNDSKSFHFDGYGEGLWNIYKKLESIDEVGDSIRNALVIIDMSILRRTDPRYGHLFTEHPNISKESWIKFYFQFFKIHYNFKFISSYIDYSIFKEMRNYMKLFIKKGKNKDIVNNVNCDFWFGYDQDIQEDSLGYYNNLIKEGVFYERVEKKIFDIKEKVTKKEILQLKKISTIFKRHNTSYKIVIAPLYDQMPLGEEQLELLYDIFDKKYIYNFSGINQLTVPKSNYYEQSHFKPSVAKKIMDIIYSK